ncbi:MAG: sugar nucleotide-binding protein [Methanomicrobiales archaeon]|nr:sugar nucleotide-binding protein [Methanomicrobiales archaeon]
MPGVGGMLGHALCQVIPNAVSHGRELDITDRDRILSYIGELKPAIVINAAAYTDVEGCEENPEYAMVVNGAAPGYLAVACKKVDAVLVHYSTDYIRRNAGGLYRRGYTKSHQYIRHVQAHGRADDYRENAGLLHH